MFGEGFLDKRIKAWGCETVWFVWEHPYSSLLLEFIMYVRKSENETKNRSRLEVTFIYCVDTLKGVKQGSGIGRINALQKEIVAKMCTSI